MPKRSEDPVLSPEAQRLAESALALPEPAMRALAKSLAARIRAIDREAARLKAERILAAKIAKMATSQGMAKTAKAWERVAEVGPALCTTPVGRRIQGCVPLVGPVLWSADLSEVRAAVASSEPSTPSYDTSVKAFPENLRLPTGELPTALLRGWTYAFSCTCPYAANGADTPCKHSAALATVAGASAASILEERSVFSAGAPEAPASDPKPRKPRI